MNDTIINVGEQLLAARRRLNLSITDLSSELCICSRQLRALEENRPEDLPGQAYVIGFLRTYATRLGLNPDELTDAYKLRFGGPRLNAELHFPEPIHETRIPAMSLLVAGTLALVGIYMGWSSYLGEHDRSTSLVPEPPERLAALLDSEQATLGDSASDSVAESAAETLPDNAMPAPAVVLTANAEAESPVVEEPVVQSQVAAAEPQPMTRESRVAVAEQVVADDVAAADEADAIAADEPRKESGGLVRSAVAHEDITRTASQAGDQRVQILARTDTWVMITDQEDRLLMEGVIRSGERYAPPSISGLKLTASNAGGLEIFVDGSAAKSLGAWGAVVEGMPLDADLIADASSIN